MSIKEKLRNIVEVNDNIESKIFDIFIQVLIILSLVTFSIETLPNLAEETRKYLRFIEIITIIIFTFEYIVRIYVADKKLSYIFSFYGMVDFFAILPFYLSLVIDLRVIRVFRLFRLLRLLKLTRYNKTMTKFQQAMYQARGEFILFFVLTLILFYLASVGIYYFEHQEQPGAFSSIFSSMWWAVATLTTVGYGDVYPITVGGKIFTTIMLLLGLGIVGIPAGIVSAALTEVNKNDDCKANKL